MSDVDELFIYLGLTSDIHFFSHVSYRDDSDIPDMCSQIYNFMIEETMIHKEQKVVVVNIAKAGITPVCVNHVTFSPIIFPDGSIEKICRRFFEAKRTNQMIIMAVMKDGIPVKYEMYEITSRDSILELAKIDAKFEKVVNVISIKPIPYL